MGGGDMSGITENCDDTCRGDESTENSDHTPISNFQKHIADHSRSYVDEKTYEICEEQINMLGDYRQYRIWRGWT